MGLVTVVDHACLPGTAHAHLAPADRTASVAHHVPKGTEWTCTCGKVWRVTKNHVGRGRICGCGWERIR